MKESAKRLHDFHHHLKAILGLAETAQNGEIQKYVGDLLSISYKEVHLCRCGNDVIDAILNCSAAEAKKQQIYKSMLKNSVTASTATEFFINR